jgi:FAD/FMN-containing dehydrogenase
MVPKNAEGMWRETGIGHCLRFQYGVRTLLPMIIPFGMEAKFFFEKGIEITKEVQKKFPQFVYSDAGNAFSVDRHYLSGFMTWYDESDPENWADAKEAMHMFQERGWKNGWTPYRWGTEWNSYLKTIHPYYDILKKLKKTLDPNNIMSPGILGLGGKGGR